MQYVMVVAVIQVDALEWMDLIWYYLLPFLLITPEMQKRISHSLHLLQEHMSHCIFIFLGESPFYTHPFLHTATRITVHRQTWAGFLKNLAEKMSQPSWMTETDMFLFLEWNLSTSFLYEIKCKYVLSIFPYFSSHNFFKKIRGITL